MENPQTWTQAHRVINQAIIDYELEIDNDTMGLSLPAMIYNALKSKDLIK